MHGHFNHSTVLFFGFCLAFAIVEVLRTRKRKIVLFTKKPFICLMCMSGWCCGILALIADYRWESLLMMFAGLFIGAIFGAIQMRYL